MTEEELKRQGNPMTDKQADAAFEKLLGDVKNRKSP